MLEFFNSMLGHGQAVVAYITGTLSGLVQLLKVWVGAINSNGGIMNSISLLPNMFIALATLIITIRIIMAIIHGGK